MELSKRLQAVADMVEPGSIVADVGCDHGYVSMYLIQNGISPRVLAMDVNRGPLERAREHVQEAGLSEYIELRLSDGLKALGWKENCEPEADTLLTAGLGGRLAVRILEDSADKVCRMKWAILQPQSEIWLVRQKLRKMGYSITDENMIFEEGKYYTVIRAKNEQADGGCLPKESAEERIKNCCPEGLQMKPEEWLEAADRFGFSLLLKQHPVLKAYLADMFKKNQDIISKIQEEMQVQRTGQRLEALESENQMLEKLIAWMT